MARTLPWLMKGATSSTSKRSDKRPKDTASKIEPFSATPPKKSIMRSSPPAHPQLAKRTAENREPSTSPPPAPPEVTLIKATDHGWIMVEDEFLATAQTFTQHLHHAEYQRQKKLAAQSGKRRRDEVEVGDTKLDPQVKREMEIARKRKKIDRDVDDALEEIEKTGHKQEIDAKQVREDEDYVEEDELIIGDRNLAGLMFKVGRGREKRDLVALAGNHAKGRTKTRAAAGLGRQRGDGDSLDSHAEPYCPLDDDEGTVDEDDLDAPVGRKIKEDSVGRFTERPVQTLPQSPRPQPRRTSPVRNKIELENGSPMQNIKTEALKTAAQDQHEAKSVQPPHLSSRFTADDTQSMYEDTSAVSATLRKAREAREARKKKLAGLGAKINSEKGVSTLEDIPTFMV